MSIARASSAPFAVHRENESPTSDREGRTAETLPAVTPGVSRAVRARASPTRRVGSAVARRKGRSRRSACVVRASCVRAPKLLFPPRWRASLSVSAEATRLTSVIFTRPSPPDPKGCPRAHPLEQRRRARGVPRLDAPRRRVARAARLFAMAPVSSDVDVAALKKKLAEYEMGRGAGEDEEEDAASGLFSHTEP